MKGAGFGFVGLLLCAGIIFYLTFGGPGNPGSARTALDAKEHSEEIANKVSGRDDQGAAVTEAVNFEESPKGLFVKTITAGSALEKKYGLKAGDVILEAGPLELKAQPSPQESIQLAYARDDTLTVLRGTQKITLPNDRNAGAAPTEPAAVNQPPAAAPEKRTNPQSQARDLLKNIPSH